MTVVTGDIAVDFSGSENPYSNASYDTPVGGNVKTVSGALKPVNAEYVHWRYNGAVSAPIIKAKVEIEGNVFSDETGPGIFDSSGNGYYLRTNGSSIKIEEYNGSTRAEIASNSNQGLTAGDRIELWLDTSDGSITSYYNDSQVHSITDTTYNSGMAPGIYMFYGNNNLQGALSFAADIGVASFAIDTIPTTITADGSFDVVVSNPATAPTTLNSAIKLTDASGQSATINSVTGSDPYTISGTFPRASTDAQFGDYALYVEVDAENDTSVGTASYESASGWQYVDVGTPDPTSEIVDQYSAGTIATGWQAVVKTLTNEDAVIVTLFDDVNYSFDDQGANVTTDQTTEFYAINASETVLSEETITFDFGGVSLTPATTIYVNMSNTGVDLPNVPAPWSYNNFIATKGTSAQQITADLKDLGNVSTSLTLDTINPFTGAIGSAGNADAAVGDWPEEVFEYAWYTGAAESPSKLRIGGLVNGDTFRVEVAGHQGTQPTRDTDFTVGGQAGTYDNSGTTTPATPLVLTGTVSGTTLDIDAALVDSFGYFTGFKIDINGGSRVPDNSLFMWFANMKGY